MYEKSYPIVLMETSMGSITLELWDHRAPLTVQNFLRYVKEGFYEGTIFHRIISSFIVQGGGYTPNMREKQAGIHLAIKNEADSGLTNDRGTIAMARVQEIDSARAQFFINIQDNDYLNHKNQTPQGFGYAVFGRVIEGMDVVDAMSSVKTSTLGPFSDVPAKPILIGKVSILNNS